MSKTWLARVTNGKPALSEWNKADLNEWCKENEGKVIRLTYETPKRSNAQNRFYRLYLEIISAENGDTEDDLHEFFKRKFLAPRYITIQGQEMKIPGSTTKLNKSEFSDFMDKICALTNVPIPDPAEAGYYVESLLTRST